MSGKPCAVNQSCPGCMGLLINSSQGRGSSASEGLVQTQLDGKQKCVMRFLSPTLQILSVQSKPPSRTLSLILEFFLLLPPCGLAPEHLASCLVISVLIDTEFNLGSSTAVFTCLSLLFPPLPHGYELLEARVFLCIFLSTRHRLRHKADTHRFV